jgi:transcriptional regulator with XRE-family HTH domain
MTPDELHTARKDLGLTQADLAKILFADPRTIRKWENGDRPIPGLVSQTMRWMLAGVVPSEWPSPPPAAQPSADSAR